MLILVVANVAVHRIYIVAYLRKHGHKHWTDWGSFGFFKRIERYRTIREREGESLFWYRTQIHILIAGGIGLIGWVILLVGSDYMGWI